MTSPPSLLGTEVKQAQTPTKIMNKIEIVVSQSFSKKISLVPTRVELATLAFLEAYSPTISTTL